MDQPSIVWITAPEGEDLTPLWSALRAHGLGVTSCLAGTSRQHSATLRVLPDAGFDSPAAMQAEYLADERPTLVLTSSADHELSVLEFLTEQDELAPFSTDAALLARRLQRLAKRAAAAAPSGTLHADALTGLPTRERFDQALAEAVTSAPAEGARAAVYLDLDHFGQINSQHGQLAGDLVLVQLAMVLGSELSPQDQLARVGADKFACLLSRYDETTLLADARRLLQTVAQHDFIIDAHESSGACHLKLSASAGLSWVREGLSTSELWRQLDVALFEAKTQGRGRLVSYVEPAGIAPLGSSHVEQAQLQHLINVNKVVSERLEQLLKPDAEAEPHPRDGHQDQLTGLFNRRYFDLRLEREFAVAQKHGRQLCLAWFDIDHLHAVNQAHGWAVGDLALKYFAALASGSIRLVDWLARASGQEFCLVMPDTELSEGRRVAERIRERLQADPLRTPKGDLVPLSLSLGVVQMSADMTQPETLIQAASAALRRDKTGPERA